MTIKTHIRIITAMVGMSLLGFAAVIGAANGSLAIAVPVQGITIDGDLSDWPEGMVAYPILFDYESVSQLGFARDRSGDFEASFRVGYNQSENTIYVAFRVEDDVPVQGPAGKKTWGQQESCEIHIGTAGDGESSPSITYYMWGDSLVVHSDGARRPERMDDVEVASLWESRAFQYEWKLDIAKVSDGQWQIEAGTSIPFDVSILDVDAHRSWSWITWGRERNKKQSSGLGDLVLAGSYAPAGRISGQVTTTIADAPYPELILHAEGNEQGPSGGTAVTNEEGRFEFLALAGEYTLSPAGGQGVDPFDFGLIEVAAGETATVDVAITPAAAIIGTATDENGLPRAKLEIELFKDGERVAQTATSAKGGYRIGRLEAGRYLLQPKRGQGVKPFDFGAVEVGKSESKKRDIQTTTMPYVARLTIPIPSGSSLRMEELYRQRLSPILDSLAFVASPIRGPTPPDSVFSRMFEMKTRNEMSDGIVQLKGDATWTATLGEVAAELGGQESLPFQFQAFSIPAEAGNQKPARKGHLARTGTGSVRPAGPGTFIVDLPGDRWTVYGAKDGVPPNDVQALVFDRQGRAWIGTSGGGVCRYDGQTFTVFTTADGLGHDWVRCLLEDRSGTLWVGTDGAGLTRYDGEKFRTFTEADGLPHGVVTTLMQDTVGNIWAGTEGGGVCRYDGETFTTFNTGDGLPRNWVASLLEDSEGTIWIGTEGGGVSGYDGERFTTFTTLDGLAHNWVDALLEDRDGNVWFGTLGGVSLYDGVRISTFRMQDGLPHDSITTLIAGGRGDLWIGTDGGGAARFDGKTFSPVPAETLGNRRVSAMAMDGKGRLMIGTERSLIARD